MVTFIFKIPARQLPYSQSSKRQGTGSDKSSDTKKSHFVDYRVLYPVEN
jgi:hypothetical protein